jgi:hypothetical protein
MFSLSAFAAFAEPWNQFHRRRFPESNRRNPALPRFYLFPDFKRKAQG